MMVYKSLFLLKLLESYGEKIFWKKILQSSLVFEKKIKFCY